MPAYHQIDPTAVACPILPRLRAGRCAGVLGLVAVLSATPAVADGTFLQFDAGPVNQGLVGSVATGNLGFGLAVSNYEDGRSAVLSATYGFDLGQIGTLKVGPAFGIRKDDGSPTETDIGARLSLERYIATGFGGIFGLAEVSTIDDAWFVLGQVSWNSGFGIELSSGASDTYSETTIALSQRLGDGPLRLRLGYRTEDREVFFGISYSTF